MKPRIALSTLALLAFVLTHAAAAAQPVAFASPMAPTGVVVSTGGNPAGGYPASAYPAGVYPAGQVAAAGCGPGCNCAPNSEFWGHFPTSWRSWPCEPRIDKTFPGSIGAEPLPTPAPETQEIIPRPAPQRRPATAPGESPQGNGILPPGGGALPPPAAPGGSGDGIPGFGGGLLPPGGGPAPGRNATELPGRGDAGIPGFPPAGEGVSPGERRAPQGGAQPPKQSPEDGIPGLPIDPTSQLGPASRPGLQLAPPLSRAPAAVPTEIAHPQFPRVTEMQVTPMVESSPVRPPSQANGAAREAMARPASADLRMPNADEQQMEWRPSPSPSLVNTPVRQFHPFSQRSDFTTAAASKAESTTQAAQETDVADPNALGQSLTAVAPASSVARVTEARLQPFSLPTSDETLGPAASAEAIAERPMTPVQMDTLEAERRPLTPWLAPSVQATVFETPAGGTAAGAVTPAMGQGSPEARGHGVAPASAALPMADLEGYCPVTLAKREQWQKGDSRFAVHYQGRTYWTAGEIERECFLVDPLRYVPAFAGNDPVIAIEEGKSEQGSIDHSVNFDGRLYLFANQENLKRFREDPRRYMALPRQ